jgi:hypothetical protein
MDNPVERATDWYLPRHIGLDERESCLALERREIVARAGEQRVDNDDIPAVGMEPLADMRPHEPRTTGDQDAAHFQVTSWATRRPRPMA